MKKAIRTIRPLSAEELTMLVVAVENQGIYCENQLEKARSLKIDQEDFWPERIERCATLVAALYDAGLSLVEDNEWDGTTAREALANG